MAVDQEDYATERVSGSGVVFDYSSGLKLLVEKVGEMVVAIDKQAAETARIAEASERMADVQEQLYTRLTDQRQGVYTAPVELGGSLTRAMTVNALLTSGQFEAVLAEMANPTSIPGYGE